MTTIRFKPWNCSAFFVLFVFLVVRSAPAQTSYPMITHVTPVAVQRGKTTEVTVEGRMNFAGAYQALFEGTGISAEIVPPPPVKNARAS